MSDRGEHRAKGAATGSLACLSIARRLDQASKHSKEDMQSSRIWRGAHVHGRAGRPRYGQRRRARRRAGRARLRARQQRLRPAAAAARRIGRQPAAAAAAERVRRLGTRPGPGARREGVLWRRRVHRARRALRLEAAARGRLQQRLRARGRRSAPRAAVRTPMRPAGRARWASWTAAGVHGASALGWTEGS